MDRCRHQIRATRAILMRQLLLQSSMRRPILPLGAGPIQDASVLLGLARRNERTAQSEFRLLASAGVAQRPGLLELALEKGCGGQTECVRPTFSERRANQEDSGSMRRLGYDKGRFLRLSRGFADDHAEG